MSHISIQSFSLSQLKREFEKQVFAIPELQRVFVWDRNKICSLMDSIYNDYPIGTALIWQVERNKSITVRHNEVALPPFDMRGNKYVRFIIDGQQRLSTIYNILNGKTVISKGKEINFCNIYFSLGDTYKEGFYYFVRSDDPSLVPLTDILKKPGSWFYNKYNKSDRRKIDVCRAQFLNYKFYFLVTNTKNIEEVRETFIRINSLGTAVSAADRAFARATNIDLRKLVSTLKARLTNGFENVPDGAILTAIALIEGSNEVGEKAINYFINKILKEEIDKREYQRRWRKIEQSIGKAIDFLKVSLEVDDYRYLPSYNMVSTLSTFYFFNNNRQPNTRQRAEIRKWFWHTGLASRYSGRGYRKNILADISFFKRLARNQGKYSLTEKLSPYEILNTDYSKNTSTGSAYFLLLKLKVPKYLDNGEPMILSDYSTIANRNDKHHIFPNHFLSRRRVNRKRINSIVNICFLAAQENQSIGGSSAPRIYLNDYKRKRHFPSVMKSNFIPYKSNSPLWSSNVKGYNLFLRERLKIIVNAFEKEAGVTMFDHKNL